VTPLHYAAANGHKSMVDLLLTNAAKPDAITQEGLTPLHAAAAKGYEAVAEALLKSGAPVNAPPRATAPTALPRFSSERWQRLGTVAFKRL
jgi:ankyrin repeat protein